MAPVLVDERAGGDHHTRSLHGMLHLLEEVGAETLQGLVVWTNVNLRETACEVNQSFHRHLSSKDQNHKTVSTY